MRELNANEKEMLKGIIEEMRECGMFEGRYDAKNGNPEFMYGISTVMECLAYRVSDEYGDSFSDTFVQNLIISEQKAKGIKCYKCAELTGCYKGRHGGKKNCKCYCPTLDR